MGTEAALERVAETPESRWRLFFESLQGIPFPMRSRDHRDRAMRIFMISFVPP